MVSISAETPTVDSVPEFCFYEDTGCEISDSCLNCPLPRCKHDDPVWYEKNRRLAKDWKMVSTVLQEQLTAEEAAERFSITIRTVFRRMERCKEAMTNLEIQRELRMFAA